MVKEIDKEFESFLRSVNATINTTPKGLVICRGPRSWAPQEVKSFCEFLKEDTSVIAVKLAHTGFGFEGAQALAEVIKLSTTLTTVILSGNDIGDVGAKALADAIKVNKSLTHVTLAANNIGAEGAKVLADAIKINRTLTRLNLAGNNIGDEGVVALADAIKVTKSLTITDLCCHNISYESAKALADAIKVNKTLTNIIFGGSYMVDVGIKALNDAVMENKNIMNFPWASLHFQMMRQNIDSHVRKNKEIASELAKFILKGENFGRNKYAALLDRRYAVQEILTEMLSKEGLNADMAPDVKAKKLIDARIKDCQIYGFGTIAVTKNSHVERLPPEVIGNIFSYITEGKDIPKQKIAENAEAQGFANRVLNKRGNYCILV